MNYEIKDWLKYFLFLFLTVYKTWWMRVKKIEEGGGGGGYVGEKAEKTRGKITELREEISRTIFSVIV